MKFSKRATSVTAGAASLMLTVGLVSAVASINDDGDTANDKVVVAGEQAGDGETDTDTTTTVDHADMDHSSGADHDASHTDGTVDHSDMDHSSGADHEATHGDGTVDHADMDHSSGTDHDASHTDGTTPHGDSGHTGHDTGGGGTTDPDPDPVDPCDPVVDGGHHHAFPTTDPCVDPDPDPDPDPEPCPDDGGHTHSLVTTEHCPVETALQYDDLPLEVREILNYSYLIGMAYPTTGAATAGGWVQSTEYFPGIAAHYLHGGGWLDSNFVPWEPEVLLYGSDGQVVGVNYIVRNIGGPPEGLPGDFDVWHEHPSLCISTTTSLVIGGENLSTEECAAIGGFVINFSNFWLLHVWIIPGWESPEGIFSHANSLIV